MKRIFIPGIVVLFLLNGCLSFRATEYRITFDEKFKQGKIQIIFEDIQSDHIQDPTKTDSLNINEIKRKRQGDFDGLLEMIEDDESLLDAVEMGIYLKNRYLEEKDGHLNGYWEGIFNNLKFDDEKESLRVLESEIVLNLKIDAEDDSVHTNGKLTGSGKYVCITWPKTEHELYWKIVTKESEEKSVSLIDEYLKWKEKS